MTAEQVQKGKVILNKIEATRASVRDILSAVKQGYPHEFQSTIEKFESSIRDLEKEIITKYEQELAAI